MARISDEELTRLKQEVSLARLAEARGIQLKPHGKDLLGLCPFHNDKESSLVITPDKNLWHGLRSKVKKGSQEGVGLAYLITFHHSSISKARLTVERTGSTSVSMGERIAAAFVL